MSRDLGRSPKHLPSGAVVHPIASIAQVRDTQIQMHPRRHFNLKAWLHHFLFQNSLIVFQPRISRIAGIDVILVRHALGDVCKDHEIKYSLRCTASRLGLKVINIEAN